MDIRSLQKAPNISSIFSLKGPARRPNIMWWLATGSPTKDWRHCKAVFKRSAIYSRLVSAGFFSRENLMAVLAINYQPMTTIMLMGTLPIPVHRNL